MPGRGLLSFILMDCSLDGKHFYFLNVVFQSRNKATPSNTPPSPGSFAEPDRGPALLPALSGWLGGCGPPLYR